MRGAFRAALLIVALAAQPVQATPPRMTMSEDRVIAATQTHLYVLRDMIDNQGSHYARLHDQHLIEIDLDTGAATRHWPLRRMAVSHLDEDGDLRLPGRVSERAGETRDAAAILREARAEPLLPSAWALEGVGLDEGGLSWRGERRLTPFGIRKAGRAQLAILRKEYPRVETPEGWPAPDRIDFYDLYAAGAWTCALGAEGHVLFRGATRLIVAKVKCEDADVTGSWSFHILVPDEL